MYISCKYFDWPHSLSHLIVVLVYIRAVCLVSVMDSKSTTAIPVIVQPQVQELQAKDMTCKQTRSTCCDCSWL